jgi:uncharacterized membrane protein
VKLIARIRPYRLALLMGGAGTTHFTNPDFYEKIVPDWMPGSKRFWVQASGVVEITCAGLLLVPRTRRTGGWVTAGTLVTVWVANIQAAIDGGMPDAKPPFDSPAAAWIRLPLQLPMIYDAVKVARTS